MEGPEFFRFLFEGVIRFGGHDSVKRVLKRRRIEVAAKHKYNQGDALAEAMKDATGRDLRGLLAELIFQRFAPQSYSNKWDKGFDGACKLFGVKAPPFSVRVKKGDVQASGYDGEGEGDDEG